MSKEWVSCDVILSWLKEQVKNKVPVAPSLYLDAATKLNVLISDETDRLIEVEHDVAELRAAHIRQGHTVAAAKVYVEATPEYMDMQVRRAKIKQIEEAIRLSKLSARMKNDEWGRG